MKKTEFQILLDISFMHRKLIAKEVIKELISLNEKNMLVSGDDSDLKNVWEEICVQVQDEYSFHWETYENTIDNCINSSISKQPREVVELFLYIGNIDFEEEQEYFQENIVEEIKADILLEAEYYKNNNITNFLVQNYEDEEDEDYEEEDEDYEEEDDSEE